MREPADRVKHDENNRSAERRHHQAPEVEARDACRADGGEEVAAYDSADDAKHLRELERENATLKRIVADKELEKVALREIARGKF